MEVFIIRWSKCVDGEHEGGVFELGYTEEASAKKHMMEDVANVRKEWEEEYGEITEILGSEGDYHGIEANNNTSDCCDWWIDQVTLIQ